MRVNSAVNASQYPEKAPKGQGGKGSRQLKTGNSLIKDFQLKKTGVGAFSKNGEIRKVQVPSTALVGGYCSHE